MKSIKQQLSELGITGTRTTNTNKTSHAVVDNSKKTKTIVHQLQESIAELIISKQPFNNFRKILKIKKIRFTNNIYLKLEEFHRLAVYDNSFDYHKLYKLLNTIDYKKAAVRYLSSKNSNSKRKNRRKCFIQREPVIIRNQQPISANEKIKQMKEATQIGLGLETNIKLPPVRSSDVKIDEFTKQKSPTEKTILYAAGWSLQANDD